MRYETIVEITPDGRPALRLVIVPEDRYPENAPSESEDVVINPYEDDDPFVIKEEVISWEV